MFQLYLNDKYLGIYSEMPSTIKGVKCSRLNLLTDSQLKSHGLVKVDYVPPEPVPPTEQELAEQFAKDCENAIQAMLDAKAKELEYDSIHTSNGWVGELPECDILKAWGGAAWRKSKEIREAILAGTKTMPESVAAFMLEIPTYDEYVGGL